MVCVYADGSVSVEIPGKGDKDRADNWFEQSFGATLMNEPQDAVIADKDAPESAIKARLEEGKALKAKQEAEKQARWKKDDEVKEQRLAKLKEILVKVKGIIAEMETKRAEADKLAWKGKADYVKKLKKLYEEFKAQVIGNDRAFVQAFDAYYWNYRSHLVKEVIPDYKD